MISLRNVIIESGDKQIVHGLSVNFDVGMLHVLMGPNGSGKSTLAHTLMGNPAYRVTSGSILINDQDITDMSVDNRARLGIFLAYQLPPAIPGVSIFTLLLEMHRAFHGSSMSVTEFRDQCLIYCQMVGLNSVFLDRSLHEGCSGGERKRIEMLQFLVSKPRILILDELDSGLDADGLLIMHSVLDYMRKDNPDLTIIMITHHVPKFLYTMIDYVYIMYQGLLLHQGDKDLAQHVTTFGYQNLGNMHVKS